MKRIVLVSNYVGDRMAMYRSGELVFQEHNLQQRKDKGLLESASDVLSLAKVSHDHLEADPRWLKHRKGFPKSLTQVKFV